MRTTPLLRRLDGQITWVTAGINMLLLEGVKNVRCLSWEQREAALNQHYDLAINLEDTLEVARFVESLNHDELFGAYVGSDGRMTYTETAREWFDLSLISAYGREEADRRKLLNRRTYQEMIFSGLGLKFSAEPYLLPEGVETGLSGDVAIAAEAGPVWPMKKWAYYDELKQELDKLGLIVNALPKRPSFLEHLADVQSHRCLISGDSLPMHFALGTGRPCVTLFNCTSPWEIYDYGIQKKIISPLLQEFFYKRGDDRRATTAISADEVLSTAMTQLAATMISDSNIARSGRL